MQPSGTRYAGQKALNEVKLCSCKRVKKEGVSTMQSLFLRINCVLMLTHFAVQSGKCKVEKLSLHFSLYTFHFYI